MDTKEHVCANHIVSLRGCLAFPNGHLSRRGQTGLFRLPAANAEPFYEKQGRDRLRLGNKNKQARFVLPRFALSHVLLWAAKVYI